MRIHRRAIAALLALTMILVACGDDDEGSSANGDGTPTTEAQDSGGEDTPEEPADYDPDGELRLGFLIMPTSLDPHSERHIGDRHALMPIWDTLVVMGNDRSIQPNLASDWEFDEEGTTLTFTIRNDITFHDGTPVTAEAARLSIERVLTSEAVTPSVKNVIEDVESMETPDDSTLVITLSRPNAGVLPAFSTMAGAVINPEYIDSDLSMPPPEASSGPYVAVDLVPDASVTYERAPNVWNPETGRLARLTMEAYPDVQAGLNALESGALDMAFGRLDVDILEQIVARNDGFQFEQAPAGPGGILYLRNTRAPLDNLTLRQAIMTAIDREAVAEHGIGAHCVPADQWVPEGVAGYIDDYDPFPFDPERARELVAESGVASPSFEIMVGAEQAPEQRAAQVIQQMLADVGITVEINPVATAEGPVRWYEGSEDAWFNAGAASPDTASLLHQTLFGQSNLAGPEADQYQDVVEAALAPGDDREERIEAAHKAALESALGMPMCFQTSRWLANERVIGLADLPLTWTGIFDPSYLAVR